MNDPLSVMIADDHPLFRMGLRYALKAQQFDIIAEAADGHEALAACGVQRPDIALLDVKMPFLDGIEACREIKTRHPDTLVVMLTTFDEPAIVRAAKEAGATGYLSKETDPAELAQAIRRIAAKPTAGWLPEVDMPELTPREGQVLDLLAQGLSNKAMARTLGLSPETVKDYLNGVYRKLEVRDRVAAITRAANLGLLHDR